MRLRALTQHYLGLFETAPSPDDLAQALGEASRALGFRHFALTHHVNPAGGASSVRLHDYPERWAEFYDGQDLAAADPVHRASAVTSVGFRWSRLPQMIALSPGDRRMLALGRAEGIADGFTVPAHIPGDANGSVSFVGRPHEDADDRTLLCAQLLGGFAFEAARRLRSPGYPPAPEGGPVLTGRQRDCALWVARGKSDWEIGRIMGRSEETVARHVRQACERYGVSKRTSLVIRALFDGTLTFSEIYRR